MALTTDLEMESNQASWKVVYLAAKRHLIWEKKLDFMRAV